MRSSRLRKRPSMERKSWSVAEYANVDVRMPARPSARTSGQPDRGVRPIPWTYNACMASYCLGGGVTGVSMPGMPGGGGARKGEGASGAGGVDGCAGGSAAGVDAGVAGVDGAGTVDAGISGFARGWPGSTTVSGIAAGTGAAGAACTVAPAG